MSDRSQRFEQLVRRVADTIGAKESAAFSVEQASPANPPQLHLLAHVRPPDADPAMREPALAAFREIVGPFVQRAKDGVIEILGTGRADGKQFCLVTLARRGAGGEHVGGEAVEVVGAAAYIVRCHHPDEARAVLRQVQQHQVVR
jgi:hypothetical protein